MPTQGMCDLMISNSKHELLKEEKDRVYTNTNNVFFIS